MDYYKELIVPKEAELETNYGSRMDTDKAMYELETYAMKQTDNKTAMNEVVNVTLNYPRTFADKVTSVITGAITQIVAESSDETKLSAKKERAIESCFKDILELADEALGNLDFPDLRSCLAFQMVIRGKAASRVLVIKDKKTGKLSVDIMPCDTRYFTYQSSKQGLLWGCNRVRRPNREIIEDYPEAEKLLAGVSTIKSEIRDFWNNEVNVIFIGDKLLTEKVNPLGYPPFVVRGVNSGAFYTDEGSESHKCESIYAALRNTEETGIYYELNRAISILATVAMYAAKPNWIREVQDINNTQPPGEPQKPGIGKVMDIEKGMKYYMERLPDINKACTLYWNIIKSAFDQAALAQTEYGNTTFPLSAVALKSLSAKNDTIYLPRINALSHLLQKSLYMLREQISRIDGKIEIGTSDRKVSYASSDISGDYRIKFKFFAVSPEEEVANYAVANAAKGAGVSRETIFTNILKFQNPREELAKAESEEIEQMLPELRLYDRVFSLLDEEKDVEAEQCFMAWEQLMRQKYLPSPEIPQMPAIQKLQEKRQVPGDEIMPLNNKDGRRALVPSEKLAPMAEVK